MNFWKLGCRWGKDKPLFLDFLTEENILIGVSSKPYNIGDLVLLTDGFIAIGVAEVLGPPTDSIDFPDYEDDFSVNKIDWEEWVSIYKARIWRFEKQDFFPYQLQQGIVRIKQDKITKKLLALYRKYSGGKQMDDLIEIVTEKKQIILQGAPGVGKTYTTKELALRLLDGTIPETRNQVNARYAALVSSGRIAFTTFHQSMDYEDFVEGYKPQKGNNGAIGFELQPGIFRQICERCCSANLGEEFEKAYDDFVTRIADRTAIKSLVTPTHTKPFDLSKNSRDSIVVHPQTESATGMVVTKEMVRTYILDGVAQDWKPYTTAIGEYIKKEYNLSEINRNTAREPCVLIIDEINRGNVSKIFGELITVLETDKREADPTNTSASTETISVKLTYSHSDFTVPYNLYIIGTMNTADRSLGQIDYALRRRFAFYTLKSDRNALERFYETKPEEVKDRALQVYDQLSEFFKKPGSISNDFNPDDIMIGHSYLMAENIENLEMKIEYEVIPLLEEYKKDGLICCQDEPYQKMLGEISARNA